jgi:DNA repair exonuclease SbcCD ATPase subunit
MAETTVGQLAKVVNLEPAKLLTLMQQAGLPHQRDDEMVSDQQKERFLNFVQQRQGGESRAEPQRKIALRRRNVSTLRTGKGGRGSAVKVETRKKKVFVRRTAAVPAPAVKPTAPQVDKAAQAAADAEQAYARAHGGLEEVARNMPDVSAAEEAAQNARLAYHRLQRLDATLRTTIEFLSRAEQRVHRDIAPRLRASVCKHLSRITGGRYTDCRIDPRSLSVQVRSGNGPWRRAELLSHGASEQVYLLLRMALAEHLSAPDETCPLILDDPIATSDEKRRRAVLDTLLAVSESTQVILFTHDRDTRDWARKRLSGPHGRLRELDREGIPA